MMILLLADFHLLLVSKRFRCRFTTIQGEINTAQSTNFFGSYAPNILLAHQINVSKTMIIAVETTALTQLHDLASRMPNQLNEADKEVLNEIYQESLENLENPESLFNYTIAKAMQRHFLAEQSQEHIYLQRFEIPQIRLFELLIQQFPLANLSQHCTNTLLIDALSQHVQPVLMDIGMGTGFQVCTIVEGLAKKANSKVQHLTIVGIEPFGEALAVATQNIQKLTSTIPFTVALVSKEAFIEQLSLNELRQLLPQDYDGLYANASFALHHIREQAQRKAVFKTLKALAMNALVVSEPNSDHYEPLYTKRFENCVHHYGILFQIIDTLSITTTEKAALKLFFSREIDDVLGNTEEVRVEKHYATQQWIDLFVATGFELQKRTAQFDYESLNGTFLQKNLSNRYATFFNNEEITSLFGPFNPLLLNT
ncbi:MAG: GRAS family protein [Spirosomataceae bacterium]